MTLEQLAELKQFGRRLARLSPEEVERRKWWPWIEKLRRREDILAHETQEDSTEERDGVYR